MIRRETNIRIETSGATPRTEVRGTGSSFGEHPPKHIRLCPVNTGLRRDTLFAFIHGLKSVAFCEGG
jgi:hypothetical protein